MKTYSQTQRRKPFNWYEFLERAIKGQASDSEIANAKDDAEDWVTCAVGNQCSIIPRDEYGAPLDNILYIHGSNFDIAITDEKWKKAKMILNKIEKRSAILINKEAEKMKKTLENLGYRVNKA